MPYPDSGEQILHDIISHRGWALRQPQSMLVRDLTVVRKKGGAEASAVVDAPVGTGKTLGYLCALAPYGRTIIATSTKALQDQIMSTELPQFVSDLADLYGETMTYSVLKGQGNYVSLHLLKKWIKDHPGESDMCQHLAALADSIMLSLTPTSHVFDQEAILHDLPLSVSTAIAADADTLRLTVENGDVDAAIDKELDHPTEPYRYALARAYRADVVVTNIALVGAEMVQLKKFSPFHNVKYIIIDEAHHAEEIMMSAQSVPLPYGEVVEWMKDSAPQNVSTFVHAMTQYARQKHVKRSELADMVRAILTMIDTLKSEAEADHKTSDEEKLARLGGKLSSFVNALDGKRIITLHGEQGIVPSHYLYHDMGETPVFTLIPMNVEDAHHSLHNLCGQGSFAHVEEMGGVSDTMTVLCSGTITPQYAQRLGVSGDYIQVPTPFDPVRHRLYIASGRHFDPTGEEWHEESLRAAIALIQANGGRAMVLTTSNARISEYARALSQQFPGLPLLYQGMGKSRDAMIHEFTVNEHSVLVGTKSFWEGVDIPGSSLTLVIIDKIPFPIIADPIMITQDYWATLVGGKGASFFTVAVPMAERMLTQGYGRLIRSTSDCGTVAILDSRIVEKKYGSTLLGMIPDDVVATADLAAARGWVRALDAGFAPEDLPRDGFGRVADLRRLIPLGKKKTKK